MAEEEPEGAEATEAEEGQEEAATPELEAAAPSSQGRCCTTAPSTATRAPVKYVGIASCWASSPRSRSALYYIHMPEALMVSFLMVLAVLKFVDGRPPSSCT